MLKKCLLSLVAIAGTLFASCTKEVFIVSEPEIIYIMSVAGVTLNETQTTLSIGETLQLVAEVIPSDATDPTVTWTNSNSEAVSVSEAGLVTALAYGSATITATAGGDNPKSATCTIVVSPSIYILTMANNQPQLWLNGESQWSITDGSVYDFNYGSSMTVSGGDVYLAMNKFDSSAWAYWAAYAKNGEVTQTTENQSYAYNMGVDGSDIYVVGYQTDPDTWESRAMLWKNGEPTVIGERTSYGYDVALADGNVYVVGQQQQVDGWNSEATLWTNGTAQVLSTYGSADEVVVSGSDVYVRGCGGYDDVNWKTIYTVWKNGEVLFTLPFENSATPHQMVIGSNGVVYVAGATQADYDTPYIATVWVDGVATTLGEAGRASEAYGISIFGEDVYVVGNYDIGVEVGLSSGNAYAPVVWKNGEEIAQIELGSWESARAVAISVQE